MICRFAPDPPVVIGLTGGVASGKSTVAGLFAECGLRVVDADHAARTVSEEPAVLAALRARFGADVFAPDGALDRAALADVVFADSTARAELEAILHPRIRDRLRAAIDAAKGAGRSVLLDAPLLVENGLDSWCDAVVHVEAPEAVRRARAHDRGWSDAELERREGAQASLAVKKSRATATIDNAGSLDSTRAQVRALLARLESRHPDPESA